MGLSIDAAAGTISGTPAAGSAAGSPYSVTVTASDGQAQISGGYALDVKHVNQAPTLPSPAPRLTTPEDTPLTITPDMLHAHDDDPAGLEVKLTAPGPDAHFTLASDGATVQPALNYDGPLSVEARVVDSGGLTSNAVTVTIDVTPVNDPPSIASIPDQSATEGVAFSLDLSRFVSDPEGDALTYRATGLPPGLGVDPVSGVVSGTPPIGTKAADYDVTLSVNDGSATSRAHFLIRLGAAGRADLAVGVEVSPNPVLVKDKATWTLTVDNVGASDVANVHLTAAFTADVPLNFDPVDAACTLTPATNETDLDCRLGPVAAGGSTSVAVSGSAAQAGQATASAQVAIADAVPIDSNSANDKAQAVLDITEQLSQGPAETLDAPGVRALAAGDFNGDGLTDIAAVADAGTLVFLNTADAQHPNKLAFNPLPLTFGPTSGAGIAAADLDGDGDIDLAVAATDMPDTVLVNSGQAAFKAVPLGSTPGQSQAVTAADINGDGAPDLVFAKSGGESVYVNDGTGRFNAQTLAGASRSVAVAAADLAGDALPDLVFANADGGATLYLNGAGGFGDPITLNTGPTTGVATADFDGDGRADLVFAASPANQVLLNTSTSAASFFPAAKLGGAQTVAVLAGDFDGDGRNDVVTINAVGAHELYTNGAAANTVFLLHPTQFQSPSAVAAVAGRFNADKRLDVAVAGGDRIEVFFNDGHGNLGLGDQEPPTLTLNGQPNVTVTVGDTYTDAGATASDAVDGDLTDRITVDNPVDTSVIGTYTVSYNVVDDSGNAAPTLTRSVEVKAGAATGGGGGGGGGGIVSAVLLALAALHRSRRRPHPSRRPLGARR